MKSDLLWIGTVIDIYFPVSVVNKKKTHVNLKFSLKKMSK